MSINLFFAALGIMLISMTLLFKPFGASASTGEKLPQIELHQFAVYELSDKGLEHFFEAEKGKKFEDFYVVEHGTFSNNTRKLFESIRSDHAKYIDGTITLNGKVRYTREDGLHFRSHECVYNQEASTIYTQGSFVITKGANKVDGTHLFYDLKHEIVTADKVSGSYYLN